MLRFHLDEHVDHAVERGLADRGIDVTTAASANLLGATDEAHLAFALRESRVIVTNDADFLRLASHGVAHPGIAFCAPGSRSIGHIIRYLSLMSDCLAPDEAAGRVEFL